MSRFKHVLMGLVLAAGLTAVPVAPAFAQQTPTSQTTVTSAAVAPDCGGCWAQG